MTNRTNFRPVRRLDRFLNHGPIGRAKRYEDILVASVLLLILAPLFLLVAVAIKLEGTGPVFVRRTGFGRYGRFDKFSFRTTVYEPEYLTPIWPQRMTSVGEFLDFTRIDGLPQIANVLRGELSFFDPAADRPSFLE